MLWAKHASLHTLRKSIQSKSSPVLQNSLRPSTLELHLSILVYLCKPAVFL